MKLKKKIELNDFEYDKIDCYYENKKKEDTVIINKEFNLKLFNKDYEFCLKIQIKEITDREEDITVSLSSTDEEVFISNEEIKLGITSEIFGIHLFKFYLKGEEFSLYTELFPEKSVKNFNWFLDEYYMKGFAERGFNVYNELEYRDFNNQEDLFIVSSALINSAYYLNDLKGEKLSKLLRLKFLYKLLSVRSKPFILINSYREFEELLDKNPDNDKIIEIILGVIMNEDTYKEVINEGFPYYELIKMFYEKTA